MDIQRVHAFYESEAPATVPLPHRSVYACIFLCDRVRCVHAAPTAKMVEQVCSMTCKCVVFARQRGIFVNEPYNFESRKGNYFIIAFAFHFLSRMSYVKNMLRIVGRLGGYYYVLKGYHAIEGRIMQ